MRALILGDRFRLKEKFTAYEQMNDVNTRFMRESFSTSCRTLRTI